VQLSAVKSSNRIWRTASILAVSVIGVVAGSVIIDSDLAKIQVRRNRVGNIDASIRQALEQAKEVINKPLPEEVHSDPVAAVRVIEAKVARQLLEKQVRVFNFCEEEISSLNIQRRQMDEAVFDLMDAVNECTILTVICAILGLYAVFWLQRYT
jgi:hypothetical protein